MHIRPVFPGLVTYTLINNQAKFQVINTSKIAVSDNRHSDNQHFIEHSNACTFKIINLLHANALLCNYLYSKPNHSTLSHVGSVKDSEMCQSIHKKSKSKYTACGEDLEGKNFAMSLQVFSNFIVLTDIGQEKIGESSTIHQLCQNFSTYGITV